MLEIFLYILIGSVAGVLAFFSCMYIWGVEFQKTPTHVTEEITKENAVLNTSSSLYMPPEPELRSSIPLQYQEISLAAKQNIDDGSYIDVDRKVDGVQTTQRIFLN